MIIIKVTGITMTKLTRDIAERYNIKGKTSWLQQKSIMRVISGFEM